MALGAHGDDTLMIVARRLELANAPEWERIAVMDDLIAEKRAVAAEAMARYKRIGKKRRERLKATLRELENRARREFGPGWSQEP